MKYFVGGLAVDAQTAVEALASPTAREAPVGCLLTNGAGKVLAERELLTIDGCAMPTWKPTDAWTEFLAPIDLEDV